MRLKWVAFFLMVSFFSIFIHSTTFAQETVKTYTLRQSIEEGIASSWTLNAKKKKIEQAELLSKQAASEFLPKLSTSYGYTRLDEVNRSGMGIPLNTKDNFEWKSTLTQPIFTGFALTSAYEIAKLGIDQTEMDFDLGTLDLALEIKTAYYNILIADKAVEVAEKEVESLKSNVKVSQSFYKVGMIPINDLLKVEVELANAQQNLVGSRNAARLTRSAFNTVLARPVLEPVNVEDVLVYRPEKIDYLKYEKMAFESRPEIKLLDINILSADQQIRLAKSKLYPEVAFNYDYIKAGDDPDVSGSPYHDSSSWRATAALKWTFWEWGKTSYTIYEKKKFKEELLETKKALQDSIRLELRRAILELETATENIPTTQKAVEQGEENLRVNEERYKAQVTTITEVLDAQALLTRARVNYFTALYNQKLARARLDRAIGIY